MEEVPEHVNTEYLKNIFIGYLGAKPEEQATMVSVIATVLRFTPGELRRASGAAAGAAAAQKAAIGGGVFGKAMSFFG